MDVNSIESNNTDQKSINPLIEQFSNFLFKIENDLTRELDIYSWSEFYSPLKYACDGGKRIRPLILVLSSEIIRSKYQPNTSYFLSKDRFDSKTSRNDYSKNIINESNNIDQKVYLAASAIELLHTESVIHDDIIDKDLVRRGKPSFHVKYGYNKSILTADFVLGIILNITSKLNNPKISSEIAKASIRMSEGEVMEMKLNKDNNITETDYIKVLENKTAALFESSARIGAILGGGNDEDIQAMGNFGNLIGIAYQIHDDLEDWNNEERLFNLLMRQKNYSKVFVKNMEILYKSYSNKAKNELNLVTRNVEDKSSKQLVQQLAELTNLNVLPI